MKEANIDKLIELLQTGSVPALSRLISLAENTDKNEEIISKITPFTGSAYVIGITGAPGVGKSTITEKLIHFLRKQEKTVAVIAVDPTSPFSGGAILGDRIRLQSLSTDDGVFIRSMASRGHLGGISSATSDAVKILDAFGFDYIFLETVGVGQSEIEVVKNVDTTILVLIPGMGDEIQAIKAGIMEIADIFVINKADKDGVERTMLELEMLQNLAPQTGRSIPIKKVIARDNFGIEELISEIRSHHRYLLENQLFEQNRKNRLKSEIELIIHNKLLKEAQLTINNTSKLDAALEDVMNSRTNVYSVSNDVIQKVLDKKSSN